MFRVINEELAAKITENARLHATLDDIEKQYETTIQTLQTRIHQLEKGRGRNLQFNYMYISQFGVYIKNLKEVYVYFIRNGI